MKKPESSQDEGFHQDIRFVLECGAYGVAVMVILIGITIAIRNCVGDDGDKGKQSYYQVIPAKD